MAVFNAKNVADPAVSGQGVVSTFPCKSIIVANTAGGPLDPLSITLGVSGAADMLISVDSGVAGAGPTGSGTSGSPFVMNVQSMTVFAKNWRLDLVYNTPNPDATPANVTFYQT